jgi:hypothetical protein
MSLSFLIIFVLWLNYQIIKNNRLSKKGLEEFWKKESQANLTRKSDITKLDYINVPYDRLPMEDNPDPSINSLRNTILSQSEKKILNLSSFSNTELKLKYGTSNTKQLFECDNNFIVLVANLHKWGERLYLQGHTTDAITVLEVAVNCKSDVHKTYDLLVKIYIEQKTPDKINNLINSISNSDIRDKEKLLSKLHI